MKDFASGISDLPSLALVLSLEYEAEGDGRAVPLEEHLAALQAGQLRGHSFVAYTDCEGSGRTTYVIAPLQSAEWPAQGDQFPSDDRTRETLQTSGAGLKKGGGFIAAYMPELSNPPGGGRLEPAPYVYLLAVVLKPGLAEDVRSSTWEAGRRSAAAHRQSGRGEHFAVYHSYRGRDEVVYVVVPLDRPEGVEARLNHRGLLQEVYGADEAARLTHVISQAITGSVSSIGKLHPSC